MSRQRIADAMTYNAARLDGLLDRPKSSGDLAYRLGHRFGRLTRNRLASVESLQVEIEAARDYERGYRETVSASEQGNFTAAAVSSSTAYLAGVRDAQRDMAGKTETVKPEKG